MEDLPDFFKAVLFTVIAGGLFFTMLFLVMYIVPMLALMIVIFIVYTAIRESDK